MKNIKSVVSVKEFGAKGDGLIDDTSAIQKAFDSGHSKVLIPYGKYKTSKTLKVSSNTEIIAHPFAVIFAAGEQPKYRGDFLLSNSSVADGNQNITINGGIWDGNNKAKYNKKGELFDINGCSGATLNFVNVKNLRLQNMRVQDSVAFHIRMSEVDNFYIGNIEFRSESLMPNQDGIHAGGYVKNGIIENITTSPGQTNDDLIALNADDCIDRVDNFDLKCGPIENIVIRNIYAEDCHTFLRMLSVNSAIKNIDIANIHCGCRVNAINMDAARYSLAPIFKDEDKPNGVGFVENITIKDMTVYKNRSASKLPLLQFEENIKNLKIINFKRDYEKDSDNSVATLAVKNVAETEFLLEEINKQSIEEIPKVSAYENYKDVTGEEKINVTLKINDKSETLVYEGTFKNLIVN